MIFSFSSDFSLKSFLSRFYLAVIIKQILIKILSAHMYKLSQTMQIEHLKGFWLLLNKILLVVGQLINWKRFQTEYYL